MFIYIYIYVYIYIYIYIYVCVCVCVCVCVNFYLQIHENQEFMSIFLQIKFPIYINIYRAPKLVEILVMTVVLKLCVLRRG